MKTIISIVTVLVMTGFCRQLLPQEQSAWTCGSQTDTNIAHDTDIPNTISVAVVFIDFPDGRIQPGNIVPTENAQLDLVANLDAVLNMGYLSNNGVDFSQKARKYTYANCWNRYFSENTYVGSAHNDWMLHGRFGLPPTGDTAKAYGSFYDYYKEVSYGNLNIVPAVTHFNETGIYQMGIVNNIRSDAFGNRYIHPIMVNHLKTYYNLPGTCEDEQSGMSTLQSHALAKLTELHNLLPSDPEYIEFNPGALFQKIIIVFAGSTSCIGGMASNNDCIVREKFALNYFSDKRYCVIHGINAAVHEFGHMLGWPHTALGNYDIMDGCGKTNTNCPSHPNIFYKLKAGWIDPSRVRRVNTITEVQNLPPSEYNGDCALVTIYGKAGYDYNYNHSEYLILENRRMAESDDPYVKFDKKLVWRPTIGTPNGFNGGLLVFHYSRYVALFGSYDNSILLTSAGRENITDFRCDEGHSLDFFGVTVGSPPRTYDVLSQSRTFSAYNLQTGLNLTNINQPSGTYNISSHVGYAMGPPPDYSFVSYSGQTMQFPVELSGSVFINTEQGGIPIELKARLLPGTVVEYRGSCHQGR